MERYNKQNHLKISLWAEEDRPREKLLLKGKSSLSNAELLGILLGSGTFSLSAVELAKKLLTSVGSDLNELAQLSVQDLQKFKGIGEAKAVAIVSALELGRRRPQDVKQKKKITSSADVYDLMRENLLDLKFEQFWIILLNRANRILKKLPVSSGGVAATLADPKIIFKQALDHLASGIILVHNHPSGNEKPSESDIILTRKLKEIGKFMEIQVLDHLIFTNSSYFSLADEGII